VRVCWEVSKVYSYKLDRHKEVASLYLKSATESTSCFSGLYTLIMLSAVIIAEQ